LDRIALFQMLGEMFGAIDGAVLTARTTESDLHMREVAFEETLYMMVHEPIDRLQESKYLAVFLEEVNNRLVKAREGLVLLVFARVMGGTAVEDISAAVTGSVLRQPALKRERVNRY
jgi:hypothetical protein